MNGEIKTHEFGELLIVAISQHASEVGRPIELWVDGADALTVAISVAIDGGGDNRQLSDEIHAVLIHIFPMFAFVDALEN